MCSLNFTTINLVVVERFIENTKKVNFLVIIKEARESPKAVDQVIRRKKCLKKWKGEVLDSV